METPPSDTFRLSSVQSSTALTPRCDARDPVSALMITCRKYEEENSHLRQEVECGADCIKRLHSARSLLSEELQQTQQELEAMQRERESLYSVLTSTLKCLGSDTQPEPQSLLNLAQDINRLVATRSKLKLKKRAKTETKETNENEPPNKRDNWKASAKVRRKVGSAEFEPQVSRGRLALTHKAPEMKVVLESIKEKSEKTVARKQSLQARPVLERQDTHCRALSYTESVRGSARLTRADTR